MMQPVALLCNPLPGHKSIKLVARLEAWLSTNGVAYTKCLEWPFELEGFASAWIVGGDGTLNYFVNRYPASRVPFTIFAGGTGNDFRWMLYGDVSWEQQAIMALRGNFIPVDGGRCNEQYFINGVGIGFDGAIVRALSGSVKRAGKWAYLIAVIRNLAAWRAFDCRINEEGVEKTMRCFMISVANASRYGGGFLVAPEAEIDDGLLDLMIVLPLPLWKRLLYLPRIMKGKHVNLPVIEYRKLSMVTVTSDKILPAHLDGELVVARQFEIRLQPGQFNILVP